MNIKTIPFDMAAELADEAAIAEYLRQVFADGDSDEIVRAFGHVARARYDATGERRRTWPGESVQRLETWRKTALRYHLARLSRSGREAGTESRPRLMPGGRGCQGRSRRFSLSQTSLP